MCISCERQQDMEMQWNKFYERPKRVQEAEILMLFNAVWQLDFLSCEH